MSNKYYMEKPSFRTHVFIDLLQHHFVTEWPIGNKQGRECWNEGDNCVFLKLNVNGGT